MGRRLISELLRRGHTVRALVRPGSEAKLTSGCEVVTGDALDRSSYVARVAPADSFVHLVGVTHPAPWKPDLFRTVDLGSAREAVAAARTAGIRHFVYVSVAQPAPVMRAYQAARAAAEALIRESGLSATILRPWYVLGPGHRWPVVFRPLYSLLDLIPATRDGARRLGLVTIDQFTRALARAVNEPPTGIRIVDVPEIRAS